MQYYLRTAPAAATQSEVFTVDVSGAILPLAIAEPMLFFSADDAYRFSQRTEMIRWDMRIDRRSYC